MKTITKTLTLVTLATTMLVPSFASAQRSQERSRQTESEWQKLAYAGAALGVLGQFNKDKTISYLGVAGGLYSAYRMEEDRKSLNRENRQRARFWSQKSFVKDGWRYERRSVRKSGKNYYKFVKVRRA